MIMNIVNAEKRLLAKAERVGPNRWTVHRITLRDPNVNVGREFTTSEITSITAAIGAESGYVTWEQWKKLLRKIEKDRR
jgi:hypothetical protein